MAYKEDTVVISVPLTKENNVKLKKLAQYVGAKNKTSFASDALTWFIETTWEQKLKTKK